MNYSPSKRVVFLLLWLALPIAVFCAPWDRPELTCLAIIVFTLIGLLILLILLLLVAVKKTRSQFGGWLLLVVILLALWFTVGFQWGAQAHLFINQSRYQKIVTALSKATTDEERKAACGSDCQIISATPLRVNFHYCHCYLSWIDFVFDASDEIHTLSRDELRQLDFYLFQLKPLRPSWSLGYFGD